MTDTQPQRAPKPLELPYPLLCLVMHYMPEEVALLRRVDGWASTLAGRVFIVEHEGCGTATITRLLTDAVEISETLAALDRALLAGINDYLARCAAGQMAPIPDDLAARLIRIAMQLEAFYDKKPAQRTSLLPRVVEAMAADHLPPEIPEHERHTKVTAFALGHFFPFDDRHDLVDMAEALSAAIEDSLKHHAEAIGTDTKRLAVLAALRLACRAVIGTSIDAELDAIAADIRTINKGMTS